VGLSHLTGGPVIALKWRSAQRHNASSIASADAVTDGDDDDDVIVPQSDVQL